MNISCKLYGWLLIAYPPDFRRRFENEMVQVFRDCYRAEAKRRRLASFWLRVLIDLILTAVRERRDSSGREGVLMNRRKDAIALLGCIGIIVIAFLLLTYGRRNEVSSILTFGYVLDALVTTGVAGNLLVFILAATTRFNSLRPALTIFAIVHAVPLILLLLVAGTNDPRFNAGAVVVGYLASFVIWAGLHWAWHSLSRRPVTVD